MPYVRTVKTASGATAVQIVYSSRRGSRDIEHIGSAHDEAELELLKAAARQRMAAGQGELDLGLEPPGGAAGRCRSPPRGWGTCWTPWSAATGCWGSRTRPAGTRCSAHWCWPGSSSRPASSTACGSWRRPGVAPPSYRTVKRRLPGYAQEAWRQRLSAACAAHARLGPASLVLYDVSTLYFETDAGRRVPRARVLQGAAPGAADHHRPADRRRTGSRSWSPRSRATRPRPRRCCRSSRRSWPPTRLPDVTVVADAGHDLRGEPEGHRGRRAVVHPRHEDPRRPLPGGPVAPGAPGRGDPRRARLHPALARRADVQAP